MAMITGKSQCHSKKCKIASGDRKQIVVSWDGKDRDSWKGKPEASFKTFKGYGDFHYLGCSVEIRVC